MDLGELRERIRQGENVHTDLKERLGVPRELSKDLVCFANTDGGQLIIGVRDDGTLVGVDEPDRVSCMVDNVAFNNCEPPLTVVQEVFEEAGKKIVVVNIPKGAQRPYCTNAGLYYASRAEFVGAMGELRAPALRDRMAHNGRRYIRQHHQWDAVLGRFERLVSRVQVQ